ncbi:MAG: hypothetical protein IKH86_03930 [Prevotella sp.]|nr:hypothetical protein [Prevotella sp.]
MNKMKNFTFRKRLLALALCAFAWIGANAYEIDGNTLIIYGTGVEGKTADNVNNLSAPQEPEFANVTTIKLVGTFTGWSGGWLKNANSNNSKDNISEIDLEKADFSSITATLTKETDSETGKTKITGATSSANDPWSFQEFPGLKTIKWPTAGHIEVIPGYAFKNTGLESVTIPGYIKFIESQAFDVSSGEKLLTSIAFEEYDANDDGESDVEMFIARQAFSNTAALVDVFVESTGDLGAANNAFPEIVTYGQGDPTRNLTRLHFPEEKAEDYVNQNHTLDEATASSDGLFQAWLVDHYIQANTASNGFYEFVSNGATPKNEDKDWGEVVLRTFSHPTIDYVVPKGAKAYIVNKVQLQDDIYMMKLKRVNVIPHGTGVILYGGTNSNSKSGNRTLEMMAVKYTGDPYVYSDEVDDDYRNLLVSTSSVDDEGKPTMEGVEVTPYEPYNGGQVKWRNFFFGPFSSTTSGQKYYREHGNTYGVDGGTNFAGFFRAKKSTIASRKAYLRVPATEFDDPQGGEIVVPAQVPAYRAEFKAGDATSIYTEDEMKAAGYWYKQGDNGQIVPIEWTEDWGIRKLASGFHMAKFIGEPEFDDELLLVLPAKMEEEKGDVYSLQGVKVNNPTKGVYIKNGKKMVIK